MNAMFHSLSRTTGFSVALSVLFLSLTTVVNAQQPPADSENKTPEGDGDGSGAEDGTTDERFRALERLIEEQNVRIEKAEAESTAARAEAEDLKRKFEGKAAEDEVEEFEKYDLEIRESLNFQKIFKFWGFFDLTFSRAFVEKHAPFQLHNATKPTFIMNGINLFFASQMTQSLSAVVELKLSFFPHGSVTQPEIEGVYEYQREDTTVRDAISASPFRQHGLTIERAYLNWSPIDWFNVTAGRFLTPYGIWNIDHGATVVMAIHVPYMQQREMAPHAQTGLYAYGRLFPRPDVYFDYGITVSNGRGPMDEVYDLDANKGVGLRLRLEYDGKPLHIAAGGYGYYGKITDSKTRIRYVTDPETGRLDTTVDRPVSADVIVTEQYSEWVATADLLVELFGFRLQTEYVWRRADAKVAAPLESLDVLFDGGSPTDVYYAPGFIGWGVYGLLAYQLPLDRWIDPVKISPYVFVERTHLNDTQEYANADIFVGGLNVKPSPYVVLKAEGALVKMERNYLGGDIRTISAQMAVSF